MHPVSVTETKCHPKKNKRAGKKVLSGSSGRRRRCAPSTAPSAADPRCQRQPRYLLLPVGRCGRAGGQGVRAGAARQRPPRSPGTTPARGQRRRGQGKAGSGVPPFLAPAGGKAIDGTGWQRFAPALAAPLCPRTARGGEGTREVGGRCRLQAAKLQPPRAGRAAQAQPLRPPTRGLFSPQALPPPRRDRLLPAPSRRYPLLPPQLDPARSRSARPRCSTQCRPRSAPCRRGQGAEGGPARRDAGAARRRAPCSSG